MRQVGIVSCGITPFSDSDEGIDSVLLDSARPILDGMDKKLVDAVLVSTADDSKYLAAITSELCGLQPRIAHTVESLCNSGTNAIISAYSYIASGLADAVLVCGAEKSDSPGQVLEWDESRGQYKHPVFWASLFSKSYKRRFSITAEQLAVVPVKNHRQARNNPNALSHKTPSIRDVMDSRQLSDDLRVLDCSQPCTGAASVLLGSENIAREFDDVAWIRGIGQKTVSGGFAKGEPFPSMESTASAAADALKMSGHAIKDVDVAEVHDAFSVCEPMALESLGFAHKGGGAEMVRDLYDTGNSKINPRGGLIGAGHPLGATGIAQAVEVVQQLSSRASGRQIDDARVGLVHNMSAAATSSTVLVLER